MDTIESLGVKLLENIGIRKNQTVMDFGCGYGAYTIPVAKIVGTHGKVYALDKDKKALDELVQKAGSASLKNIEELDTSEKLEIEITDESVDVVLLFDVFHSFYFPQAEDRRRLLREIYRIMKSSALLCISVWPNLVEPEIEDEIKNAHFHLKKAVFETLTDDIKGLEKRKILCFSKERYISALDVPNK